MSELIGGRNNVLAALKGRRTILKVLVAKNVRGNLQTLLNAARERGCPVQFVPREKLDEAAGEVNHQGVLAFTSAWEYVDLDHVLGEMDMSKNPVLLMLANVEDPHNFGSLLRSSDCAGVSCVIIPKRRSAQLNETVAKVSMGAVESVPVARVTNLAQALEYLKEKGFWIAAADMDGERYTDIKWDFPVVLVLGGEGTGVPRLLRQKSDYVASIPVLGTVESLNVSVAGAIMLYEIVRQRGLG
ncbi:MAG: 23S rRNA (guanosine(2251)-2'-O)-methyltransferase RlmB [Firmicutes bacterium]|nr:23S rRNA (guanosine(2251)-2'-O)-methyltransferase RlmB [Bacillota bacterium]